MSLVANLTVGAIAILAVTGRASANRIAVTNQGPGTLFFQVVAHGATSTLTTSNGTQVTSPAQFDVTPAAVDFPTGFDVYLISGTSTTANVQTLPI